MTLEDFNSTQFTGNMRVKFKGRERDLFSVNFDQGLIGLIEDCSGSEDGDVEWVRCENITILNNNVSNQA